jgi:hypothetical protein
MIQKTKSEELDFTKKDVKVDMDDVMEDEDKTEK